MRKKKIKIEDIKSKYKMKKDAMKTRHNVIMFFLDFLIGTMLSPSPPSSAPALSPCSPTCWSSPGRMTPLAPCTCWTEPPRWTWQPWTHPCPWCARMESWWETSPSLQSTPGSFWILTICVLKNLHNHIKCLYFNHIAIMGLYFKKLAKINYLFLCENGYHIQCVLSSPA